MGWTVALNFGCWPQPPLLLEDQLLLLARHLLTSRHPVPKWMEWSPWTQILQILCKSPLLHAILGDRFGAVSTIWRKAFQIQCGLELCRRFCLWQVRQLTSICISTTHHQFQFEFRILFGRADLFKPFWLSFLTSVCYNGSVTLQRVSQDVKYSILLWAHIWTDASSVNYVYFWHRRYDVNIFKFPSHRISTCSRIPLVHPPLRFLIHPHLNMPLARSIHLE